VGAQPLPPVPLPHAGAQRGTRGAARGWWGGAEHQQRGPEQAREVWVARGCPLPTAPSSQQTPAPGRHRHRSWGRKPAGQDRGWEGLKAGGWWPPLPAVRTGAVPAGGGLQTGPSLQEPLEQPQSLGTGVQCGGSAGTPHAMAAAGCGVRHTADGTHVARAARRAGGSPLPAGGFPRPPSPPRPSATFSVPPSKASRRLPAAGWGSTSPLP